MIHLRDDEECATAVTVQLSIIATTSCFPPLISNAISYPSVVVGCCGDTKKGEGGRKRGEGKKERRPVLPKACDLPHKVPDFNTREGVIYSLISVNFKLNASVSCFTSHLGTRVIVRCQN
jgi:hypothetical protein